MSLFFLLSLAVRLCRQHKTRTYGQESGERPNLTGTHTSILFRSFLESTGRTGPHARKFINFLLRDADNTTNSCQRHLVHHPKCPPQCHLQTTTYGSRHVTLGDCCHTEVCFVCTVLLDASTVPPGTHTAFFSLKPAAAVPCGLAVTSLRPTITSTTLRAISSSCLRTLTLRPLCLRASVRLMS